MSLVRFLLIAVLTLSVSLSGAMDVGYLPASVHDHAAAQAVTDDQPICCQDSTERTHTCHALLALIPTAEAGGHAPAMDKDAFCASGVRLAGIEPSGLLDPPRAM